MTLRTFSYGGGVQSTAALVLAAQGKIDFSVFLFSNVGDDSEHPATLRYVWDVAMPYAEKNGIEFLEVRPVRFGQPVSLYQDTLREDVVGISVPMRGTNGAPGIRSCTKHYKIIPIAKETRRRGATPTSPAVLGLGISLDEYQRMSTSQTPWQVFEYPLIDLRLTRQDCINIIERAGLPVPPKSACWFCPFLHHARWKEMKEREPALFMNAVVFEQDINAKQRRNGKPPVFLTRAARPLHEVFGGDQATMFEEIDDMCDSGMCMT